MLPSLPKFAFVCVQTTGGSAATERIVEIAIIRPTPDGVQEWTRLVNPERGVAESVQATTGITRAMLLDAPIFEELARDVTGLLEDHILVAHNARGVQGVLRKAFGRMNAEFDVPVLCTARLSRRLFPKEKQHGLDPIINRHGLNAGRDPIERHRALGQARLCLQFWQKLQRVFSPGELEKAVNRLVSPQPQTSSRAAAPQPAEPAPAPAWATLQWENLDTPFQAALMSAQARTGLPPHTGPRHSGVFSWRLARDLVSGTLMLSQPDDPDLGFADDLYGVFKSRNQARHWLRELALQTGLCTNLLGLDERSDDPACPARRAGRCLGACLGKESAEAHFRRLSAELQPHRVGPWPHEGPLLVQHGDAWHVMLHWRYLGFIEDWNDIADRAQASPEHTQLRFDADLYTAWQRHQTGAVGSSEYR